MGRPSAVFEEVEGSECSLSSVVDMRRCESNQCCMAVRLDGEETAEAVGGCIEVAPVLVGSAAAGSIAAGHIAAGAVQERETDQGSLLRRPQQYRVLSQS